jgi:hypothetical protein
MLNVALQVDTINAEEKAILDMRFIEAVIDVVLPFMFIENPAVRALFERLRPA